MGSAPDRPSAPSNAATWRRHTASSCAVDHRLQLEERPQAIDLVQVIRRSPAAALLAAFAHDRDRRAREPARACRRVALA
jgi:hypothetical protein